MVDLSSSEAIRHANMLKNSFKQMGPSLEKLAEIIGHAETSHRDVVNARKTREKIDVAIELANDNLASVQTKTAEAQKAHAAFLEKSALELAETKKFEESELAKKRTSIRNRLKGEEDAAALQRQTVVNSIKRLEAERSGLEKEIRDKVANMEARLATKTAELATAEAALNKIRKLLG